MWWWSDEGMVWWDVRARQGEAGRGRARQGEAGTGLEEKYDWRRNRYIKIFDYFRLVEGDTLAILNMRSKLDTEE